jgi:dipeptidyl aminopeptidase/acylaminoacyl peptidase
MDAFFKSMPNAVSSAAVVAPCGSWRSPIISDLIVAESINLVDVWLDGKDVYWCEGRPEENGRYVVVHQRTDGTTVDLTPPGYNARTRVHEYGGGAVCIRDGVVYFSNFDDQKLYRLQVGKAVPQPIGQSFGCRYADANFDAARQRIVCVREDHSGSGEAVNTIVALAADGSGHETVLVSGNDFYSNPRLSPNGRWLAWLTWNHPHMPWISTELWVAKLDDAGTVVETPRRVAGSATESLFQPEWSPEGVLHFVSDISGWWNLYREEVPGRLEALFPLNAEFGQPQWNFGQATYAFVGGGRLLCTYNEGGESRVMVIGPGGTRMAPLTLPFTEISVVRGGANEFVLRGGAPDQPASIARVSLDPFGCQVLRRSTSLLEQQPALRDYLSRPQLIGFDTTNGRKAYAWYYPAHNPAFKKPENERPPLIVKSHGGPTASTSSTLDLRAQFWTSRGFAIVDVDYGGSTGYGREYRERLHLQWGIVDLDDCTRAARHLASIGEIDGERVAITGGSAGGYTTLCGLVFGQGFFKIGASYYGIGDLETLARDTHKFESRYLDWLVGKYPEEKAIYVERSPIHFTDRLRVPVILFQGEEDKVVPPNQAELFADAVRRKGLPLGYLLFKDEQHGFRRAENIKRSLDAELDFYSVLLLRSGLRF